MSLLPQKDGEVENAAELKEAREIVDCKKVLGSSWLMG